jgi:Domain of unknown function (DUF1841)
MFNPTRDESREFLFTAWNKFRTNQSLTGLEALAVEVITLHPEYHSVLENRDKYSDKDYAPESGATNPFLHIYFHIGIREQISIDQPAGVRAAHTALTKARGNVHEAEHEMMDCLAEMIWQAQRSKTAPDAAIYLACLKKKQVGGSH